MTNEAQEPRGKAALNPKLLDYALSEYLRYIDYDQLAVERADKILDRYIIIDPKNWTTC